MNPSKLGNRDRTPSSIEPNEASNQPARTALVLGITSFALIPASVLVLWVVHGDVQLDTWTVIVSSSRWSRPSAQVFSACGGGGSRLKERRDGYQPGLGRGREISPGLPPLAELLIDCQKDRVLRAVLVGMLREDERGRDR